MAPGSPGAYPGYRAEVRAGTAATLTLHLGRDVDAVVAVVQAFWRRGR
jgi:hypothetical protein